MENFYLFLVPPTSIEILNHLSGSKIEVKENEEVEIACKVSNAKPKARIFWYRNNVAFKPGLGEYRLLLRKLGLRGISILSNLRLIFLNLKVWI